MQAVNITVRKLRSLINRPHSINDIFVILGLLIILLAIPFTAISLQQQRVTFTAQADTNGLAAEINAYRKGKGLPILKIDKNLVKAACWLSTDMARKNYFTHIDSKGRNAAQRLADYGVGSRFRRGENIAAGQVFAAAVLEDWKASAPDNATLLSANFSRVGVGFAYKRDSTRGWYWVADFASGRADTSINQSC